MCKWNFWSKLVKKVFKYLLAQNLQVAETREEIMACFGWKNAPLSFTLFLSGIAKVMNSHSLAEVLSFIRFFSLFWFIITENKRKRVQNCEYLWDHSLFSSCLYINCADSFVIAEVDLLLLSCLAFVLSILSLANQILSLGRNIIHGDCALDHCTRCSVYTFFSSYRFSGMYQSISPV